jgi:hypothetical protein
VGIDTGKVGFVLLGGIAALLMTTATALAEPEIPAPPPPPAPDAGTRAAPPDGTPHLASPQNLPPGTSDEPVGPPEGRNLSYLRELWHAVQTQNISGKDAILLLTQRPLDPNATPPPGVAAGPQSAAPEGPPPPTP